LIKLFLTIWKNRFLILELSKRDFTKRYQGSYGGVAWSVVQPIFLLGVYTLVFSVILQTRWSYSGETKEFALILFAGLIILNTFTECLNKAPLLITDNPNFVKKVVFPLEILPWVMVSTVLLQTLISIVIWFLGFFILFGPPNQTALYFPVILLSFFPILLGIGWLLSAVGVIIRDISQITLLFSHSLLFLTPIFYSKESAPPVLQNLLMLNPLTYSVEQFRFVLFFGQMPGWAGLTVYFLFSLFFAWASLKVFRLLQPGFADLV